MQLLISLQWTKKYLYVDVPRTRGISYRQHCLPMSRIPENSAILPLYSGRSGLTPFASQTPLIPPGFRPDHQHVHPPLQSSIQTLVAPQSNSSRAQQTSKEIYCCIDKVWTEPSQTLLHSSTQIDNDDALYKFLNQRYIKVQGWVGRIFSWKTCTDLNFVQVSPTNSIFLILPRADPSFNVFI